jgi:hypothetical protein
MLRVSKRHPCPICEKPDWCLYSEDGTAAICARISEGSKKRCGEAGWLFLLDRKDARIQKSEGRRPTTKERNIKPPGFETLTRQYQDRISQRQMRWLGASLGITEKSLQRLCIGFDGKAFTFPMRDENMRIIGIRRRFGDGNKKALAGSCNGLFIPTGLSNDKPLFICEGPTDCAVALDLGFEAIGRPNCDSKIEMTVRFAKGRKIVVISDNDPPGRSGAKKLANKLIDHCPEVKIICPPVAGMDLRQWRTLQGKKGFKRGQIRYGF